MQFIVHISVVMLSSNTLAANDLGLCVRAGNRSTNAGFITKSSIEKLSLSFALQPA
jgi:hypothetical protein